MTGRVRVFIACSLDGFIAGDDDDISWLPGPDPGGGDGGFAAFLSGVGCILMGRKTYDVAAGFEGPWPYGAIPVHVVTSRALVPKVDSVRAVQAPVVALVNDAQKQAHGQHVYLDGGTLIRSALAANLVDDMIVTIIPTILGRGAPLFAGTVTRQTLALVSTTTLHAGMVQLHYRVIKSAGSAS